uniref:Homeodomain protein Lbx n=1 Tax=Platynereis dumerilii TaxID=6359 RepID=A5HKM6_PLADU|nr:homeodomain protein Lbx [Platynereis dumerilii]
MATAHAGGRDRYEPIKRLGMVQVQPPRNPNKPLTSFFISDILNSSSNAQERKDLNPQHKASLPATLTSPSGSRKRHGSHTGSHPGSERFHPYLIAHHGHVFGPGVHPYGPTAVSPQSSSSSSPGVCRGVAPVPLVGHGALSPGGSFVRPWADSPPPRSESCPSENRGDEDDEDDDDDGEDEEIRVDDDQPKLIPKGNSVSPLDALLQMTSKTFDGLDSQNQGGDDANRRDQLSLFSKNTPPKKRRKSRTAFTNQQIYELEKRFLYQKYLTPADRDEIAGQLGLSNAQVITWFQNRRAKLKRDLEELKADVTAAKSIDGETTPPIFDSEDEYQAYKNLKKNGCPSEGSSSHAIHQGSPKSPSGSSSHSGAPNNISLSVSINTAAQMAAASRAASNMAAAARESHENRENRVHDELRDESHGLRDESQGLRDDMHDLHRDSSAQNRSYDRSHDRSHDQSHHVHRKLDLDSDQRSASPEVSVTSPPSAASSRSSSPVTSS